MTIEEAKNHAKKYGWSQKLGYSKRELGIKTPKDPTPRRKKHDKK